MQVSLQRFPTIIAIAKQEESVMAVMRTYVVSGFSRTVIAATFVLMAAPAFAQQPTLAPGCTATPAQLDANKKVAMEFFRPGADRVALADPAYKQHNPAFVKGGREAKLSDYEYFKSRFGGPA